MRINFLLTSLLRAAILLFALTTPRPADAVRRRSNATLRLLTGLLFGFVLATEGMAQCTMSNTSGGTTSTLAFNTSIRQTFKPTCSGTLSSVAFTFDKSADDLRGSGHFVKIQVRSANGTVLASVTSTDANNPYPIATKTYDFSCFNLYLISGTTYQWEIVDFTTTDVVQPIYLLRYYTNGTYADGNAILDGTNFPNADFYGWTVNVVTNSGLASSATAITQALSSCGTYIFKNASSQWVAFVQPGTISGNTTAKLFFESAQPTNFVSRHYEIMPASNGNTATGSVTLYFTQAEFNAFNAVNSLKLPTGPSDNDGITNLLIESRLGTGSNSTGLPSTYSGSVQTINPADADVVWSSVANRWEITFNTTGFGGFFLKTTTSSLTAAPLALNNFTASPATLLTTETTTLSATVSGGTAPYNYRFSGSGTIAQTTVGSNTATVSGLSAGVQTFTLTATDATTPTKQTITGTVSVTVTTPNTAPTATANANQTATVGQAFTYTVKAFTDAETPNSLTYSASISPANGLSFDAATRIISGTPSSTGVSSVTVSATDPGGLSASTSFTITVKAAPVVVTSLSLTASARPTAILTTQTTTLSAYVSGGTAPYSYTFSGPGTIATEGNAATVSGLSAGVQTFTVVVTDATKPTSQTITGTVSIMVTAPVPNGPACDTYASKTTADGLGHNAVRVAYAVGNTLYVATYGGLGISTDKGNTFVNQTTANGLGANNVYGVYAVGSTVYAATDAGVSISTDGGNNFTNYTNGLGAKGVRGIYAIGNTVYAATYGGLSISTDGGSTFDQ